MGLNGKDSARGSIAWPVLIAGIAIAAVLVTPDASARRLMKFEQLAQTMQGHLLPMSEIDPRGDLADCSQIEVKTLDAHAGSSVSQWIYNASYAWTTVPIKGTGTCLVLDHPFHRGLSRDEAQMLLSASRREWPVEDPPAMAQQDSLPKDVVIVPEPMPVIELPLDSSCAGKDCFPGLGAYEIPDLARRKADAHEQDCRSMRGLWERGEALTSTQYFDCLLPRPPSGGEARGAE